jgi:hypothetical protein
VRDSGCRSWFWRRRSRSRESATTAVRDERPFGWSVQVSDWPVGKTQTDLSARAAIRALSGLGDVYDDAMQSLAGARDPEAQETGARPGSDH